MSIGTMLLDDIVSEPTSVPVDAIPHWMTANLTENGFGKLIEYATIDFEAIERRVLDAPPRQKTFDLEPKIAVAPVPSVVVETVTETYNYWNQPKKDYVAVIHPFMVQTIEAYMEPKKKTERKVQSRIASHRARKDGYLAYNKGKHAMLGRRR